MAGRKENIKALFSNTRTRVIILFTFGLLTIAVLVGIYKFSSLSKTASDAKANINTSAGAIESVPGALNPTAQYAALQEMQNINQAQSAAKQGKSAIPTIIRSEAFGEGVQSVGPKNGQGGVGFSTLEREQLSGPQQTAWYPSVKSSHCSKSSIEAAMSQGAQLSDLKSVCTCAQLKDNGIQLAELQQACTCKELKQAGVNVRQMKEGGFSAAKLRQCGFDACELRAAGFTAQEMKDGGYSDGELKGAGFSDQEIAKASGLPEGITPADVENTGCSASGLSKLRTQGVTAAAIVRISGCNALQMKAAGFSATDLHQAGLSAAELKNAGFSPQQMRQAGYSARDLLNAGFMPAELSAAGFTPNEITAGVSELPPGMNPDNVKMAGCNTEALQRERMAGVSARLIRDYAGCSVDALKSAGFTNDDLAMAGFTPQQISQASAAVSDGTIEAAHCDPVKLKSLMMRGVSAKQIHDLNACSAADLKQAGYGAKALLAAGFKPYQLVAAGFEPSNLPGLTTVPGTAGVSDATIQAADNDPAKIAALYKEGVSAKRIRELAGSSLAALKAAGYSAKELEDAGFTPQQLLSAGFTAQQVRDAKPVDDAAIKSAGCSAQNLRALYERGVSARRIHLLNGCSAQALRDAGYDAFSLTNAGFTPQQLQLAGFTPDEISRAQLIDDQAVHAAGCDVGQLKRLKDEGVTADRIKQLNGCSISALKDAGFDAGALANAGFTPQQLLAAGFSPDEVKATTPLDDNTIKADGCDPTKLQALYLQGVSAKRIHDLNGCSAEVLKNAGFDALSLADAGFTPQQLLTAGFTPQQLLATKPIDDSTIRAAGCNSQKLHELFLSGASAIRIHQLNGCGVDALRNAGFSDHELLHAGFSPQELAQAGFTAQQLAAAGITGAQLEGLTPISDEAIRAAANDPQKLAALHSAGVSAARIRDLTGASALALKNAGFTAEQLADAGFTPQQLLAAGFTPAEVNALRPLSDSMVRAAGCDSQKLHELNLQGVSAYRIHKLNGCSVQALQQAGFDDKALAQSGFAAQQLAAAGITGAQLEGLTPISDEAIRAAANDPQKLAALHSAGVSAARIRDLTGASALALKNAGFTAEQLADAGFTPQQLLAAGFTPAEVNALRPVSDSMVRAAGCDSQKLHELNLQGVSAYRIHKLNGCSVQALQQAGFDDKALAQSGFTAQQLAAAGISGAQLGASTSISDAAIRAADSDPTKIEALRLAGVSAKRIHSLTGASAQTLKNAGFSLGELANAGYTPQQLVAAGFSPSAVRAVSPMREDAIHAAGCDVNKLSDLQREGVSARRITELNGCGINALKQAGFDIKQLANDGFTPQQLMAAGFSPAQITQAGLNPSGVIAAGRTANCNLDSLKAAHELGVSGSTIKQTLGCSASSLKNAGYTAMELKSAGYSTGDLKKAGFSAADLRSAGFDARELVAAGYSAQQLKQAGFTEAQLKAAGFKPSDLKALGLSAAQLKAEGYSAAALKQAGYSAEALRKAGYSAKELSDAGFSPESLRAAGYSANDLKAAGFSLTQLQNAGYSSTDLQNAGVTTPNTNAQAMTGPPTTPLPSIPGGQPSTINKAQAAEENTKQLHELLNRQQKLMADQHYQQKIQQRASAMMSVGSQDVGVWKSFSNQLYIGGNAKNKDAELENPAGAMGSSNATGDHGIMSGGNNAGKQKAIVQAGDVLFAVLDTSVNSDEPGPILATIVSGRFNGAKLIGSFNRPSNADKMIINFNTMSVPGEGHTTSISAYAIDPNTARTALSSRVNHHYLVRYGSLFAATFLEGFGNAFQSANTTITVGGVGGQQNTTITNGVGRSILENAVIGLATLGKSWSQVAMQEFSLPTTVELFSGVGIGILFTQDLKSL